MILLVYQPGDPEMNATMDPEIDIPTPVRFNPLKHHRKYILGVLNGSDPDVIINLLDPLCNNYIDIYTGVMTPASIGNSVISMLESNQALRTEDFRSWIALKNGYQKIKLEDQSEWIVRESNETERYIHIHPAHTGMLTIRFKGSTLKTAFLLKVSLKDSGGEISLGKVNQARIQIGLSPIQKLERGKGILNCYENFYKPE